MKNLTIILLLANIVAFGQEKKTDTTALQKEIEAVTITERKN